MQAYRVHLSPYFPVYVYCKETYNISSLSVTLSLRLFAIILGIKCHCFDTIAQTQKWFLKGDRAISLLLDLWGWRGPACLSEQKKGGDDRVSHHLPKWIFNSHTQTHTSSGGKNKTARGSPNIYMNNGYFLSYLKSRHIKQVILLLGVNELTLGSNIRLHDV